MRSVRVVVVGVVLATVAAVVGATPALAQWPTTCVELNDIVESHLGNDGNVGIYQRVFDDQAEEACQNDHRDDVRSVFAWAFADGSPSAETAAPDLAWPTDCVELNDIVETHLGNDRNVGIYQRVFVDQAEAGCRSDHLEDVQTTFAWAQPSAALTTGPASATGPTPDPPPEPVRTIGDYANASPALQELLSQLPALATHTYDWLHDGISRHELSAIRRLQILARDDLSLALSAATSPWMSDSILRYEERALSNLRDLRQLNPELARRLLGYTHDPQSWPSDVRIIYGLPVLQEFDADRYDRLTRQPWFVDGLDRDERVFVYALVVAGIGERFLFDQLLSSHHRQSAIVSLPLAGRVRLTAFQPQAFPDGEDLLGQIEQAMRGAEQFMRVPFPTTDVVVLLGGIAAGYENQRLRLARSGFRHVSHDLIIREVAHFYFTYDIGPHNADHQAAPLWLHDSGAEFIRTYIHGGLEVRRLPALLSQWEADSKSICVEHGFGNLHQLTIPDPPDKARWRDCDSILGRYLLLRLYEAMGEDAMSSALRDIYLLASQAYAGRDEHGIMRPSERDVYGIFLEHTPPSRRNVVRRIYQSIHGGPFVDDQVDVQGVFAQAFEGEGLAFVSLRDEYFEIFVMHANGSGESQLTRTADDDINPTWSPDGRRLAFSSNRDGNAEIYVMHADSGLTRLTHNPDVDADPAWAPDGRRLAFASDRDGDFEIYVIQADGSGLTQLTHNATHDIDPAWAPDGRRLAFASNRDGDREIFVMRTDGGGLTQLTINATHDVHPAWSPDGRRLAFASDRDGDREIFVMHADGSGLAQLTHNAAGDVHPGWAPADHSPAWSPDGRRLAFASNRDGDWEIYVMQADGSGLTQLTHNSYEDASPVWRPAPT